MAFKLLPEEKEDTALGMESLHRIPAQAAKGAGAFIAGGAGDIASLVHTYVANPLAKLLGGQDVPYEESQIGKILPTTEQHKKRLEEGIPYLKPKNKVEKFVSDVGEDTISLFLPGKALEKVGLRGTTALKSFATALGANAAGKIVEDLTGDPKKGAYTKMGTMILGSLINKPAINKEIGNLYNKADKLLPKNATVRTSRLEGEMKQLKNKILAGRQPTDLAASEKFVVDQADTILRQVQNGKANVGTLKASLRSLNENLQKAVYEAPSKGARVRAKSLATQINRSVNNTLKDYGRRNPEWWKLQKSANEAYGTVQQSNFISRFIENNISGSPVTHGLAHALGAVGGAITGVLPYQGAKLLYRIYKSPALRTIYARVVASAAAENATIMNKEIKKLDKKMQTEEKEEKVRFRLLK